MLKVLCIIIGVGVLLYGIQNGSYGIGIGWLAGYFVSLALWEGVWEHRRAQARAALEKYRVKPPEFADLWAEAHDAEVIDLTFGPRPERSDAPERRGSRPRRYLDLQL